MTRYYYDYYYFQIRYFGAKVGGEICIQKEKIMHTLTTVINLPSFDVFNRYVA